MKKAFKFILDLLFLYACTLWPLALLLKLVIENGKQPLLIFFIFVFLFFAILIAVSFYKTWKAIDSGNYEIG